MKTLRTLFWGGVAGATLGLLFAPQRGDATRARLRERMDDLQQEQARRMKPSTAATEQGTGLATKAARNAWETSNGQDRNAYETAESAANA